MRRDDTPETLRRGKHSLTARPGGRSGRERDRRGGSGRDHDTALHAFVDRADARLRPARALGYSVVVAHHAACHGRLTTDVILPGWDVFQSLVTALELRAGAALAALGQQFFLQLVYLSSERAFEQPHEWVPLVILALVPAGRTWGFDGRLADRGMRRFGGWPF
jgi:hypothetical protein